MPTATSSLDHDVMRGAEVIAEFIYGDRRHRRRIYHLIETSQLPHFKLGALVCARKSTLLAWIEQQEQRSIKVEAA